MQYSFILFKHSKKIIGILLLIFIFLLVNINNFQLDASSESLVLEGDKDLLYYQQLRKVYKSDNNLIISYQVKNNLLAPKQLEYLNKFIKDLESVQAVKNIVSILTVPLFSSPQLSIIDLGSESITINNGRANLFLAKKEFKNSPLYSDNLVSADGKTTAILLSFKQNLKILDLKEKYQKLNHVSPKAKALKKQINLLQIKQNKKIKNAIQNIRQIIKINSNKAKIFLGGLPMISNDIIAYIANDLIVFSIIVISIMAFILLLIFRSLRFMLLPLGISLVVSLSMTGLLGILGWKVTIISSNFFSLLLVMTLSIMIHLVVRYRELAQNSIIDKQQLINNTIKQMFKPCIYTTLTTLIAFVSLLISGIRPVIDFGYMMAIGVILAFILSFISFPLLMNLLPNIRIKQHTIQFFALKFFAFLVDKFGKGILIFSTILLVFSLYGISKISVENRFIDYFKTSTEIHQGLSLIDEKLGGTIPLEIIFDDIGEDYFYDEDIRLDIKKVHRYLDNNPALGKVISIDTTMQLLSQANGGRALSGFFLNIIKGQMPDSAKKYILTPYISEDTGKIRIVVRVRESTKNLKRTQLIQTIKNDIIKMGFKENSFHLSGMMVLYNNMLQSLFTSQIKTIGAVFLMIWLMFLILFKSIKIATIAIVSNILPSLLILGIMGVFGIPLDLMTITIAAIAIGIGVDNAIHYIIRFKLEFIKNNNYKQSMFKAHSSIGLAMFYTSITVALGFLVLVFSNFIPSLYFGIFTAIAMFSAVILNLTLLPKLLILFKPKL